jgi:hypothetical protein
VAGSTCRDLLAYRNSIPGPDGLRSVRRRRGEEDGLAPPRDEEQAWGPLADDDTAEHEAPGREATGASSTNETGQPDEANSMYRDPRHGPPPHHPQYAHHWAPTQVAPQWQQYHGHPDQSAHYGHPAAHAAPVLWNAVAGRRAADPLAAGDAAGHVLVVHDQRRERTQHDVALKTGQHAHPGAAAEADRISSRGEAAAG